MGMCFLSSAPLTVEIVRADRTRSYLGQIFRVTVRLAESVSEKN